MLRSWSAKNIGSVRLQLAIAKEIVLRLDAAQDIRVSLATEGKALFPGSSLQRTLVKQRARITYLAEGDANTKIFHLQACHRSRKGHISKLKAGEVVLFTNEEMANAVFEHFHNMLGTPGEQLNLLNYEELGLNGNLLDHCFSEEEVWQAIGDMPTDKAPGPDGFTGMSYKTAWSMIKDDIMHAF